MTETQIIIGSLVIGVSLMITSGVLYWREIRKGKKKLDQRMDNIQ